MMGSFITRAIIMVLGYIYPAYECFKCVEKNRPDIEQLRFWCQYWIIIAILTVFERLGDTFIAWLPMYSEAKLAFIIYLWYPKTKGTTYVYTTFLRPFVATHELEIDRNLNELRTRVGDVVAQYWQKGSVYVQSRFMELIQYMASEPRPQQGSVQPPPQPPGYQQPPSNYQPQPPPPPPPVPPPPAAANHEPSAPALPSEYESRVAYHHAGFPQPPYVRREGHNDEAINGVIELQSTLQQPTMSAPATGGYMTRRQRSRRQQ